MIEYFVNLSKNVFTSQGSSQDSKTQNGQVLHQKLKDHFRSGQQRIKAIHHEALQGNFSKASSLYQEYLKGHSQVLKDVFDHQIKTAQEAPKAFKNLMDAHHKTYEGLLAKHGIDRQDKFASSSLLWKSLTASLGLMAFSPGGAEVKASTMVMEPMSDIHGSQISGSMGGGHIDISPVASASSQISQADIEKALNQAIKSLQALKNNNASVTQTSINDTFQQFMNLQTVLLQSAQQSPASEIKPIKAKKTFSNSLSPEDAKPHLTTGHIDSLKELKNVFKQQQDGDSILDTLKKSKQKSQLDDVDDGHNAAKSLNDIQDDILKTATGAYLHALYPKDDLETALGKEVDKFLRVIKKKRDHFDKSGINPKPSDGIIDQITTNYDNFRQEVIDKLRNIMINTTDMDDYYVFYHGHDNNLKLYFDALKEFKAFEDIQNLGESSPLRDKLGSDTVKTADDFLTKFQLEINRYVNDKNQNLAPGKKALGLTGTDIHGAGFKYDNIDFSRNNALSTNINLFGNDSNLAESSLYYFLDSFNIASPNKSLVKSLIKRFSVSDLTDTDLDQKIDRYVDIFQKNMSQSGGTLQQIFVHKSVVDDIGYASWRIGIPVMLDQKTQTVAIDAKGNPVLDVGNLNNTYDRPSMSDYYDLLVQDSQAFAGKYAGKLTNKPLTKKDIASTLEKTQARLIVDPEVFQNPDLVKIKTYTRFDVSQENAQNYQQDLHNLVTTDAQDFLNSLGTKGAQGQKGTKIEKLSTYVKEGTQTINQDKIPEAPPLVKNLSAPKDLKTASGKNIKVKTRDWGADFQNVSDVYKQSSQDRAELEAMRVQHMKLYDEMKQQDSPDFARITKIVTQDTIEYINRITQDIVNKIGEAPTKFSLFSMGSMPRDESGFYTDLEIGVIVEENTPQVQMYFEKFGQILADRLYVLGEHPEYGGKGLRLDEADNAPKHKKFFMRHASKQQALQMNREYLQAGQTKLIALMQAKNIPQKKIDEVVSLFDLEKGTVESERVKKRLLNNGFTPAEGFKIEQELLNSEPYREGSRLFVASVDRFAEYLDPTLPTREANKLSSDQELKKIRTLKRNLVNDSFNKITSQPNYSNMTKKEKQELTKLLNRYADQIADPLNGTEQKNMTGFRALSRNMVHLFGKSSIFEDYLTKRTVFLNQAPADKKFAAKYASQREADSMEMLKSNISQLKRKKTSVATGKMEETFEVKRHLYRFLEQTMTGLGFSYDVGVQNGFEILDALVKKGIIGPEAAKDFRKCMMFAADLRLKEQQIMKKQGHEIPGNIDNYNQTVEALQKEYKDAQDKYTLYTKYNAPAADLAPFIEKMSEITAELKTLEKQKPEQEDSILDPQTLDSLQNDILPTVKTLFELTEKFVNGDKKAYL